MTGQVVDALATPVVGYLVDLTKARKAWYIAGAFIAIAPTYVLTLLPVEKSDNLIRMRNGKYIVLLV